MVSINKKIIETIKKMADELEDAPGAEKLKTNTPVSTKNAPLDLTDAPGVKPTFTNTSPTKALNSLLPNMPGTETYYNKPNQAPARPISYSVPAVKEMQKAILEFADVASSTDMTSMKGNQQGQQTGNQTRALPNNSGNVPQNPYAVDGVPATNSDTSKDKEFLGGSDPFGNFIIQHYFPKDSFTGKQYLNVDVSGNTNREHQSTLPINLRGLIDTLKRIGSPGSSGTEKSADGIWQTRTNNALHVMADIIDAMVNLTKDMNIQVPFDSNKLKDFKSKIPNKYTDMKSQEEIIEKAKSLTPDIKEMTAYFNNLKPAVLENKDIRKYIDQKEPFAKYDNITLPKNLVAITEQDLPKQSLPININKAQTTVSLTDLYDMDHFKKFVNKQMGGSQDATQFDDTVKKVLNMVADQLNSKQNLGF